MSMNGNTLTNGKNGKKRRRRIIWVVAILVVLGAGGYGVMAALRPSHEIDPSKLAIVESGDQIQSQRHRQKDLCRLWRPREDRANFGGIGQSSVGSGATRGQGE